MMHRSNVRNMAVTSRGLHSKQFVAELHDQGSTRDDAIEAVCQVFGVSRGAAELFIVSHPAWADEAPAEEPEWWTRFTV